MKKLRSPLVAIFLIVLVDILGLTIVLPLLPFYAEKYGGSPSIYGLLVTSFALCQLISGPYLGQLSDRYGRKPILIISQIGTFAGFILLGATNSLALLFLSRIIDGCTAGNLSIAQAYISDVTEPQNRAKAFGIIGISFGIGFLIGPALAGFLSQYGFHYPAFFAAGLSFLSIMGTTFLLPPKTKEHHTELAVKDRVDLIHWGKYKKYFADKQMRGILIQYFLFAFAFSCFISGNALFSERRFSYGPREVGYLFAYSGLLGIFIQGGLLGRLVKKLGERKLVVWGFISMGLGYILIGLTYRLPVLLFVYLFSAFGSGVLRPALTSLITRAAPRTEQGRILGLNQSLNSVAQIIAPLIAGALIDGKFLFLWALVCGGTSLLALSFHRQT